VADGGGDGWADKALDVVLNNAGEVVKEGLKLIGLGKLTEYSGIFNSFLKNFKKFIENPPRYIVALLLGIVLYVVNTISNALSAAISAFEAPAEAINTGLMTFGDLLGGGVLNIVGSVNRTAINFALGAGPLAPIAVFFLWLAEMYLLYLLIMAAASYAAPVLQSVVGGGR